MNFIENLIKQYNCHGYIQDRDTFKNVVILPDTLLVTGCTGTKRNISQGTPKELYITPSTGRMERFISVCEKHKKPYGIISGITKGLLFHDEIIKYYDNNPPYYTEDEYDSIGDLIQSKARNRGFHRLVHYGISPLQNRRYFKFIQHSKMEWYFCTRLFDYLTPTLL